MPIIVRLDVMLARRKMRSRELAERIGITEQNLSLLKSGKVKGIRFTLPRALLGRKDCDFSFSGLKTAAARLAQAEVVTDQDRADLACAVQNAIACR